MTKSIAELIVYACPTGEFANQLDRYFDRSKRELGENAAHGYMPHVTLTGFFHDEQASVSMYREILQSALERVFQQKLRSITLESMVLGPEFHYVKVESEWLKVLAREFEQNSASPTRLDAIRVKDWLHLSLAYAFPQEQNDRLADMARESIELRSATGWELRLYERREKEWIEHGKWVIING